MKPPSFDYARPASVEEALALLERPGAKLLAGGQSLIPLLNLRLARPSMLVDIGRLQGLAEISLDGSGSLHLGALVTHARLLVDETVGRYAPLIVQAAQHIGHVAIRNRGTLGGSLAHADPAAELATAVLALGGRIRLAASGGERWLRAADFFEGPFTTAAREDEMLLEVALPPRPSGEASAFVELAQRSGDFAIAAAAVRLRVEDAKLVGVHVAVSGAGGRPFVADDVERRLEGAPASAGQIEEACAAGLEGVQPTADVRGSAGYKRAVMTELTARAVRSAVADAQGMER